MHFSQTLETPSALRVGSKDGLLPTALQALNTVNKSPALVQDNSQLVAPGSLLNRCPSRLEIDLDAGWQKTIALVWLSSL